MNKTTIATLIGAGSLLASAAANATVFADRITFEAGLTSSVTDDYENAGYNFSQSDAQMSAVLGETEYTTTGFSNNDLVPSSGGNQYYCAGCNGSFLLDFTSTSVGTSSGVFGVGFDFFNTQSSTQYNMFVTYGDGATENILLDVVSFPTFQFFGITSDDLISSIHFGLLDGGTTTSGSFGIDNLTIGSGVTRNVPAPSVLMLMAIGLLGMAGVRRIV